MDKEKIFSFVKEWKKSFIALGVMLVMIILLIGYVFVSMTFTSVTGMNGYQTGMDFVEFDRMESSPMMAQSKRMVSESDIPMFDEGVAEYDQEMERKVIKNGNLSLVVVSIDDAKEKIQTITKSFDGFVQDAHFRENENYEYYHGERRVKNSTKSGYFELKIPTKNFEEAFDTYKEVALKVNNESVSGRDVTEEFLDLESQIQNKQAEVDQYRSILKKAVKIEDILKVTKYLNAAQSELDRKQGKLNYLSNQVELSSIRIDIVSEKDVEVFGIVWSPLTELKAGFSSMLGDLRDFVNMVIALLFKLPSLILNVALWALGFYAVYKILKKIKNKLWKK